jgi:hypothetical protein
LQALVNPLGRLQGEIFMKNKFDAEKYATRISLEKSGRFDNLFKLEQKINQYAKALLTLWPDSVKDWDKGQHVIIRKDDQQNLFTCCFNCYFTTYQLHVLQQDADKKYLFDGTNPRQMIGCFTNEGLKMYVMSNPETYGIITLNEDDSFNIVSHDKDGFKNRTEKYKNYQEMIHIYKTNKDEVYRDSFTVFTQTSLVCQCVKKTSKAASSMGGNAKAIKQTGYQKVKIIFQNHNGKPHREEEKSLIDAYKLSVKYIKSRQNKSVSLKWFRNLLKGTTEKKPLEVDCGLYSLYINLLNEVPSSVIINNTGKNKEEENSLSLIKEKPMITLEGTSSLSEQAQKVITSIPKKKWTKKATENYHKVNANPDFCDTLSKYYKKQIYLMRLEEYHKEREQAELTIVVLTPYQQYCAYCREKFHWNDEQIYHFDEPEWEEHWKIIIS